MNPRSKTRLQLTACFLSGATGVFSLAGLGTGRVDASLLLPVLAALLAWALASFEARYAGPMWALRAFGLCGLLVMPVAPLLLTFVTDTGLFAAALLLGLIKIALVCLFCLIALYTRNAPDPVTEGAQP